MATKVFQRGNFIIVEKDLKESIIPIDNFDYDFVTPTTLKLKDVQEGTEINESVSLIQDESGTPVGGVSDINDYFATFLKESSGGGGGNGDASAANQITSNDQTSAKKVGYVLNLANNVPPPYNELVSLTQTTNGVADAYQIPTQAAANTEELAELFNDLQSDIYYGALSATELYFVPVSSDIVDVSGIEFEDNTEGTQAFSSPFTATTDVPTGALHQLVTLMQKCYSVGLML